MTAFLLLVMLVGGGADDAPLVEFAHAEIKAKPGRLLKVTVKSNGKIVKWAAPSDECDLIQIDGKSAIFASMTPGRYRIIAYTAIGDQPSEPAICTITVGDPIPPPTPPTPPGPNPPPPGPVDPLTAKLQKAFDADASDVAKAKKDEWRVALVGFFKAMGDHANNRDIKTLGDLLADYRAAVPALLPDGALTDLRKTCGAEVAAIVGEDSSPERELVAVFRAQLSDGFKRIAKALEGVK